MGSYTARIEAAKNCFLLLNCFFIGEFYDEFLVSSVQPEHLYTIYPPLTASDYIDNLSVNFRTMPSSELNDLSV